MRQPRTGKISHPVYLHLRVRPKDNNFATKEKNRPLTIVRTMPAHINYYFKITVLSEQNIFTHRCARAALCV